jgi:hypothetical protein
MEVDMAEGDSWLPGKEQDLVDLCEKWDDGLDNPANTTAFGWNPAEVSSASARVHGFLTARTAYEKDNSSRNRLIKDEAKQAAKAAMRDFANTSIRHNKLMQEEDKRNYGIHTPDPTPSPVTAPTSFPEAKADTSVIRLVGIHFWDSVTKKRGKPHGVHGAEIRWAVLDRPPVSVAELAHSDFDTASPFTLTFDETDRGKRLYFCLRWETNTNLKGPDGEIYSAIIP